MLEVVRNVSCFTELCVKVLCKRRRAAQQLLHITRWSELFSASFSEYIDESVGAPIGHR